MTSELSNLTRGDSYRLATSARSGNGKSIPRIKRRNANDLKQELDINAHRIPIDELYESLATDPDTGLTNEEARQRLAESGPNILTPVFSTPAWILFCKNLFGGFNLLLWIGAVLSFIAFGIQAGSYVYNDLPMDNLYLAVVLMAIVLLSASFLFYQERKSMKIMESFEKMVPYKAIVVRNGFTYEILAEELVVGDIITIQCGDRIPADIRLISATSFKVDNSVLTGESEAQVRNTEYTNENSLETKNLAFFSTNAVEGSCKGVVINTGDGTVIGRIANLASSLEMKMTPIAKEINLFIYIITAIAFVISIIWIIAAFMLGYYWIDSIMLLIAIIIACVPEGLMATVTICLTLTAQRMAKKNCLVKHLEAVETLGSTKVICCDKTGTLTQNRMTVTHVCYDNMAHEVDMTDDTLQSTIDDTDVSWKVLLRDSMLCNHSTFLPQPNDKEIDDRIINKPCTGDSSEAAILRITQVAYGNVEEYRSLNKKVYEIPFNSMNKYQVTIHETEDQDRRYLMVMKGAPEMIINFCSTVIQEGAISSLNNDIIGTINNQYFRLGEMGERVIAFAECRLDENQYFRGFQFEEEDEKDMLKNILLSKRMTLVGMMSMKDPPRANVTFAIQKCRQAGIKVIMVTGDHPVTAKAIARDVGIINYESRTVEDLALERGLPVDAIDPQEAKACVVHGNDLANLTTYQLDDIMQQHTEIVFARTTPHQKVLIVESCQRLGAVVAVTGDGVNDSPALKKADIGVSMGISGSDVSKQAADMILLDDNFCSIVDGVEEGRLIFDNLKKSICYTLTSNIPEITALLLFFILNIPLPLGTITILLIDLGTDMFPAVSLAYELAETDIMRRQPRDAQTDRLVSHSLLSVAYGQNGIIEAAAGFFSYFVVMAENGFWPQRLVGLRQEWDSLAINDVSDSYGQEWSYRQRKYLEHTCHAAFFVAIVMTQWINLLMCKTRRNSIFKQGMRNHHLTVSLVVSLVLALIFVYVPGLDIALRMQPLRFTWWLPALPYMAVIFAYNEIRKVIIRKINPEMWFYKEAYY